MGSGRGGGLQVHTVPRPSMPGVWLAQGFVGSGPIIDTVTATHTPSARHTWRMMPPSPRPCGKLPVGLADVAQYSGCSNDPGHVDHSEFKAGGEGTPASLEAPEGTLNQHAALAKAPVEV